MSAIFKWLNLPPCEIDPERLDIGLRESDSRYHMKYLHKQTSRIGKPARHEIAPRIQAQIETAWAWYYEMFYPQHAGAPARVGSVSPAGSAAGGSGEIGGSGGSGGSGRGSGTQQV